MDAFGMFSQPPRLYKLPTHHALFTLLVRGKYRRGLWAMWGECRRAVFNNAARRFAWVLEHSSTLALSRRMRLDCWRFPVIVVTNTFERAAGMALRCLPIIVSWAECSEGARDNHVRETSRRWAGACPDVTWWERVCPCLSAAGHLLSTSLKWPLTAAVPFMATPLPGLLKWQRAA